jgi:hypothetical protein
MRFENIQHVVRAGDVYKAITLHSYRRNRGPTRCYVSRADANSICKSLAISKRRFA